MLVFAEDGSAAAEAAAEAGADHVGLEEPLRRCREGWTGFDVAIATPSAMAEVRKLGKVLGPRGLMPNPRTGTVAEDTAAAVREVKAGRVEFKIDKTGNIHVPIGKLSFPPEHLRENAQVIIDAVVRARPAGAKGTYLVGGALSGTMSPPFRLDLRSLAKAA